MRAIAITSQSNVIITAALEYHGKSSSPHRRTRSENTRPIAGVVELMMLMMMGQHILPHSDYFSESRYWWGVLISVAGYAGAEGV